MVGDYNGDGVSDLATANGGSDTVGVLLSDVTQGISPLEKFSLATQAEARQALPVFQRKLSQLAEQRGQVGAFEARLGVAINKIQAERENYLTAKSQITDADIAFESAQLIRNSILQQAGAAILAQANQAPQLALLLLGDS